MKPSQVELDPEALLSWYEPRRRAYPWRRVRDPYRVWISEVMLQQTQAARVVPAYVAFIRRFPDIRALAAARRSEVISAWGNLGYNRRAVAVSEAARILVGQGRGVPDDPEELRRLPGVGPYTAGAVASLAFGRPVAAIDTNVRRVVARIRFGADPTDVPASRLSAVASGWVPRSDPGAWNQALMDLGREVCRPRPRCPVCPVAGGCRFLAIGVGSSGKTGRRSSPFEGSPRQVRGVVVRLLRRRSRATLGSLCAESGFPIGRVAEAITSLSADGIVRAGPAALSGRPGGSVRLAD